MVNQNRIIFPEHFDKTQGPRVQVINNLEIRNNLNRSKPKFLLDTTTLSLQQTTWISHQWQSCYQSLVPWFQDQISYLLLVISKVHGCYLSQFYNHHHETRSRPHLSPQNTHLVKNKLPDKNKKQSRNASRHYRRNEPRGH